MPDIRLQVLPLSAKPSVSLCRFDLETANHLKYSSTMSTLSREEIVGLSPPERLTFIGELWDSLSDAELPLPPSQQYELKRRLARSQ